jgi:hypothetical protein
VEVDVWYSHFWDRMKRSLNRWSQGQVVHWYTVQFTRSGPQITGDLYIGSSIKPNNYCLENIMLSQLIDTRYMYHELNL